VGRLLSNGLDWHSIMAGWGLFYRPDKTANSTIASTAEVWLNGERLGARAWDPYWFRTGKALRQGTNELHVQITNTLANYLVSPAVRADWAARKGPGWPGVYDARAHDFESKSTKSGLFGPVRLLAIAAASSND
jgi:hypothetical protein